jgi:translation elongation factor EF-Ts
MSETQMQDLQALKDITSAGVLECKKALTECEGDKSRALLELLKDDRQKMLKLAQNEFTAAWILESLAKSNVEEVVFAVSKNPSTPKATKATANQDSTTYSNKQNVADHDRQIAELRREITQIKKAYNSLLISLESRDKEISELLEAINKNSSQRTSRTTSYVTFSIGEF